jgi:NADH dehydrogenase
VLGDLAHFPDSNDTALPGVAPVAIQQGRYAARKIQRQLRGRTTPPFRYKDRGSMAVIGRSAAVAQMNRIHFHGLTAWFVWLFVHLVYLVEFENRLLVLLQWGWNYITRNRSARLITYEAGLENSTDGRQTDHDPAGRDDCLQQCEV